MRTHRRYWAWYRRHYDAIWDSPATEAWAVWVAEQVGGPVVVDIGCGTGLASQALRSDGRKVLGVDSVPTMVWAALEQDRCTAALEADALRLPLASASVDGVLLANVLHVVAHPELVLREARRVVRPGGRIVVCWPHDDIHPRTVLHRDIRSGRPVREALWAHALRILVGIPGSAAGVRRHRRSALLAAVEAVMSTEGVLVRADFDVVEVLAVRPRAG